MKLKIFILFFACILSFNACDILRFSRFEIESWTPGGGYHSEPENIKITLNFSNEPDKISAERNFSLTGEGERIRGNFIWNGKSLTFSPLAPLEINTDYIINISADAHDVDGLSMDEAFCGEFTTRPDNSRPVLLSCYPPLYADITDSRFEVKLEFSAPVTLKTLYENVSFSPSMTGLWRLENNDRRAVFSPSEPWAKNKRYEIRLSSSLTDSNGMNIRNDFTCIFTTGTGIDKPYLLNVMRITRDGSFIRLSRDSGYSGAWSTQTENNGWEKDDRILLIFSKPVDSGSVKNFINADDGPNLVMESPVCFNEEIVFSFENPPLYQSRFTLRIKPGIKDESGNESNDEYVFRVFADGKYSRPPVLAGLRMPMAPENEQNQQLKYFSKDALFEIIPVKDENYPSGESVKTWIELYFDTAEGAAVDLFSVMELFRIETSNNVITFSAREVKDKNFSHEAAHQGTENYQRIEIKGNLVNSTYYGLINFQIAAGLCDSLGNKNEKSQKISLIK